MFNIKHRYGKYKRAKSRNKLKTDLINLEKYYRSNSSWSASLRINCQILTLIDPKLLTPSPADYKDVTMYTGFTSVMHLFNWTQCICTALRNREVISFDMTNIMYQRKTVSLAGFTTTPEQKRYPVDALYVNLLTELETMIHLFGDIKDPRYADRSSAALDPLWVDVFAVVEMLCTLGVHHE